MFILLLILLGIFDALLVSVLSDEVLLHWTALQKFYLWLGILGCVFMVLLSTAYVFPGLAK